MAGEPVPGDLDFVDDFYFSAILDESDEENEHHDVETDSFQVSDAKYAEKLQFQEALMGCVIISQIKSNKPSTESPVTGQSSQSFCEICAERKENNEMFATGSCVHSFCSDCISRHVSTKIRESITVVTCPGINCRSVLELDVCRTKLSKRVIDLWEEALCLEMISQWQKVYCPFKDCSALLVNDNEEKGTVMRECECPYCHRMFCAECNVPWHSGVECGVFQTLNQDERGKEDLMVMELAHRNQWSRCPNCRFYVERTEGCPHMICRCKFEFCYGCGLQWTANHGGCSRT
ncbi:E3 ubiquitin-protein ligase RSL1-like [Mercurialis annua]|uniref:E3 ubiquitin-protein ligase RSL1-like n=1 Tax=Mercurialis annua TaxID=3986 RepID=UPI002160561B|nr:E3 ubiquitin-protein ligase RSL1-like [Mercurialis annua]